MGEKQLSIVETELYDRQIRLWGIESQEKLRAANVLLIGVRGLGSEVAKNILLSGVNSLMILDDGIVTTEELFVNFLLEPNSIGNYIHESILPKAYQLNPLVQINTGRSLLNTREKDFLKEYTVVIATGLKTDEIIKIDGWCRSLNIKFICGDVSGMFGYTISDFQEHEYYEDQIKLPKKRRHNEKMVKLDRKVVKVQGKIKYPDIGSVLEHSKEGKRKKCRNNYYYLMLVLLQFKNKYDRDLTHNQEDLKKLKSIWAEVSKEHKIDPEIFSDDIFELMFGEVVPICSIVGGIMAQEAIKAVSGKEVPINNVFLLNPVTYSGKEETINI